MLVSNHLLSRSAEKTEAYGRAYNPMSEKWLALVRHPSSCPEVYYTQTVSALPKYFIPIKYEYSTLADYFNYEQQTRQLEKLASSVSGTDKLPDRALIIDSGMIIEDSNYPFQELEEYHLLYATERRRVIATFQAQNNETSEILISRIPLFKISEHYRLIGGLKPKLLPIVGKPKYLLDLVFYWLEIPLSFVLRLEITLDSTLPTYQSYPKSSPLPRKQFYVPPKRRLSKSDGAELKSTSEPFYPPPINMFAGDDGLFLTSRYQGDFLPDESAKIHEAAASYLSDYRYIPGSGYTAAHLYYLYTNFVDTGKCLDILRGKITKKYRLITLAHQRYFPLTFIEDFSYFCKIPVDYISKNENSFTYLISIFLKVFNRKKIRLSDRGFTFFNVNTFLINVARLITECPIKQRNQLAMAILASVHYNNNHFTSVINSAYITPESLGMGDGYQRPVILDIDYQNETPLRVTQIRDYYWIVLVARDGNKYLRAYKENTKNFVNLIVNVYKDVFVNPEGIICSHGNNIYHLNNAEQTLEDMGILRDNIGDFLMGTTFLQRVYPFKLFNYRNNYHGQIIGIPSNRIVIAACTEWLLLSFLSARHYQLAQVVGNNVTKISSLFTFGLSPAAAVVGLSGYTNLSNEKYTFSIYSFDGVSIKSHFISPNIFSL